MMSLFNVAFLSNFINSLVAILQDITSLGSTSFYSREVTQATYIQNILVIPQVVKALKLSATNR